MTRDAIENALAHDAPAAVPVGAPSAAVAPVVDPSAAAEVVVTAGTAVVLYKLHLAQRAAEEPRNALWRIALLASKAIDTLRAVAVLGAILIAMVAGGTIGVQSGILLGILAMVGGTLAIGGTSLFMLQLAELFLFRGLARRA